MYFSLVLLRHIKSKGEKRKEKKKISSGPWPFILAKKLSQEFKCMHMRRPQAFFFLILSFPLFNCSTWFECKLKLQPQRRINCSFIVHLGKEDFLNRLLQEQTKKSVKILETSGISLLCQKKCILIKQLCPLENKWMGSRFLAPPQLYLPCSYLLLSRGSLLIHVRGITASVSVAKTHENSLPNPRRLWMQKILGC